MTLQVERTVRAATLWPRLDALAYGADYNPEQWPEEVWIEDVALMREAGVNLVSLGIFSWALLEPAPGVFEFAWLDRIIGLLHEAGIHVDLATPTAAAPAWFLSAYPHVRPVTAEGVVLGGSARQTYCPHAPEYRAACRRIADRLAARYAAHPAVVMWHVHNEYGAPTAECYCPVSAAAFREWLRGRYGSLDALNAAWTTAFWGQQYSDWSQIDAPRRAPMADVNPAHRLDFRRFTSDSLLELYAAERDAVRARTQAAGRAEVPITTNFQLVNCKALDVWEWARHTDLAANDHYLSAERQDNHIELALCADFTRSVGGGGPWLLMEHSTSAVSWQPRNLAKRPGQMRRNTLAHVARGADGALFFQWRASRGGGEKFHSAMVPHGGTGSRVWREVVSLGADLAALREIQGSTVLADAAVLWDWESWWALEHTFRPSVDLDFKERQLAYHEALWRAHVTSDIAHPGADLSKYRLVVAPQLYLCRPEWAENLRRYVRGGGTLVVSYFSGIVDQDDSVWLGGYPGALRELLGVWVEEFLPLRADWTVRLTADRAHDGAAAPGAASATVWAEDVDLRGAEAVLRYADGPAAGKAAVTRHAFGDGHAWYVSTRPDAETLREILRRAAADAGVPFDTQTPDTLELVARKTSDGASYLFAINHGELEAEIAASGVDVLTGERFTGVVGIPAGGVRVVRRA
ncbi:beta-galactosidase [Actinocrinis puniceicyclus]|uniref:Beta-galactosidase n=1 Tax=Actinocrinis puniceicyclus TaxID=977794 RepID=A0A8J7WNX9_9ACTN|nr:beta-galactosidase [Actinocrinis puniceicyclus]MBS2963212.1 beta-galactosidase [Actinocrinis puniceicyclus]